MKVGIVGNMKKEVFGVGLPYMTWASQFGDVIVITPDMEAQKDLGLVIMVGGIDIDPKSYGQKPGYFTSRSDTCLEFFDKFILPEYVEAGIPVFGICRGFQAINVHFGGTLKQHIYGHPTNDKDRTELKHKLDGVKGEVNSMHHQCLDEIGDGLGVLTSFESVPEAIQHDTLPVAGVQWHPEEIHDDYSLSIVNDILSIANNNKLSTSE